MTAFRVILFFSLLCQPVFSEAYSLETLQGPNSRDCLVALNQLGQMLLTDLKNFRTDSIDKVHELLTDQGMDAINANLISVVTQEMLQRPPASSPIIKEVSNAFSDPQFKNQLFVVATNKGCRDRQGDTVQGFFAEGIRFVDFRSTPACASPPPPLWEKTPIRLRALYLPGTDSPIYRNPFEYAPIMMHELTHVADMEKLLQWIKTNEIKNRAGTDTDSLFKKVVRYGPKGFEVDMAFLVSFLEGRAYLADRDTRKYLKSIGNKSELTDDELAEMGYRQIDSTVGSSYLLKWGIHSPKDFFAKFEKLTLED